MNVIYFILGLTLILSSIIDLLWTTLWVDGSAGPISRRLTTFMWNVMRKLGGRNSRTLSLAGPVILTITLFVWVGLLWGGWAILFASDAGSIFDTRDQEPVTWIGYTYFGFFRTFGEVGQRNVIMPPALVA